VRSPNVLMGELARSLGVTEPNSTRLKYAIGDRMAGTGGLLIIDETQHLKNRATLDMVRALHDQHEIGIAMLGNAGFFAGTGCGSSEDGFAQFFSRIGSRRMFRGPQAGDIEMMLDAYGIEGADERGFLGKVGRKLGALRALEKCIRMGAVLAAGSGEPPAVAHFKGAYADLAQAGEG
jgi:DNA transposition AAA+ family ATPase